MAGTDLPLAGMIAQALEAEGNGGVASPYLFGSHAEGCAHRESDVDVAVLLRWDRFPSSEVRFEEQLRLIGVLCDALQTNDVDLVVLNEAPPLFARRIVWEGVRVYLSDPEMDHAFVRTVQSLAADLEPWLRRMQQIKLDALRRT